jgi:WD40 repeat protein
MLGTTSNDILVVGTSSVHLFRINRGSLQRSYSGHVDSVISVITHPDPDEMKLFTASQDNRFDMLTVNFLSRLLNLGPPASSCGTATA